MLLLARVERNGTPGTYVEVDERWTLLPDMGTWLDVVDAGVDQVAASAAARVTDGAESLTWDELRAHRVLPPVEAPGKVVGVGLNYRKHAEDDFGGEVPDAPLMFAKWSTSLCGPYDDVALPTAATSEVDYEVELTAVVGTTARDVAPEDVDRVVVGYMIGNDLTARDVQRAEAQWTRAKSFDGFCPLGPWLALCTHAEIAGARLRSWINGELRQDGQAKEMVFSVGEIVAHLSQGTTLRPGDVILTGTPVGVGLGRADKVWLRAGDVVTCSIDGLGIMENVCH